MRRQNKGSNKKKKKASEENAFELKSNNKNNEKKKGRRIEYQTQRASADKLLDKTIRKEKKKLWLQSSISLLKYTH